MKSIFETLAVLGTGAILLTGCASHPVKAKEVPAATAKPEAAAPVETKTDAAAAAETTKPEEKPADNAAATPATTATPATATAPKKTGTGKGKKPTAKKGGADAGCGEGTCG